LGKIELAYGLPELVVFCYRRENLGYQTQMQATCEFWSTSCAQRGGAIFDRDWVDEAPGPACEPPAQIVVDWKTSRGLGGRCRDQNGLLMSRLEERERVWAV
jgi:hypothetical protein